MTAMASQITGSRLFAQPCVQAQIKENIKAPRHWPLWGESTGDRWLPVTKGQLRRKKFPFDDAIMGPKRCYEYAEIDVIYTYI